MEDPVKQSQLAQKLAGVQQRSQFKEAQTLLIELGIPLEHCKIFLPDSATTKHLEQWLSQAFPWQYGQIDWEKITESICISWHHDNEVGLAFQQLCQNQQLGNPCVNVIWFSAHHPTLEISLELVQLSLAKIVAEDWDTWIFEPITGWCIEFYHEGTMCFGKSSTR